MKNRLNRSKIKIVFQSKADQPRTYLVMLVYRGAPASAREANAPPTFRPMASREEHPLSFKDVKWLYGPYM